MVYSDVNEKKYFKRKDFNIDDILLFAENPRFTLDDISYNLKKISKEIGKNENDVNYEKRAINQLLMSEGDKGKFNSFKKLIDSLKNGFNEQLDVIPFLIKNENFEKNIVIEGNRRIFALKLLYSSNNFYFDEFKKFNFKEYSNFDEKIIKKINLEKELLIKELEILRKNKIEKYTIPCFEIEWNETNREKITEKIKEIILSRHSYTENETKKDWPRLKSLTELLIRFNNDFKKEINKKSKEIYKNKENLIIEIWDNIIKNLSSIYTRDEKKIKSDIYTAVFVLKVLKQNWKNLRSLNLKKFTSKISSIELSLTNVRSIIKEQSLRSFLNLVRVKIKDINYLFLKSEIYKSKIFNEEKILYFFLDHLYKINNGAKINKKWENTSDFLLKALEEKWLTTRGYKTFEIKNKTGEIILKEPINNSIEHISNFFEEDILKSKAIIKRKCILYKENEDDIDEENEDDIDKRNENDEKIEDMFHKIWKFLETNEDFSLNSFINKSDSEITRAYKKFINIENNEYDINEEKINELDTELSAILFIKDLKKINIKVIETKSKDIYLNCILNTWNHFVLKDYNLLFNITKGDLTKEGSVLLNSKYFNLIFLFRAIIESVLIFEVPINWEDYKKYPEKINSSFLALTYGVNKDSLKNKDDIYDLIFNFDKIKKFKINGLNTWVEKNKKEINKKDNIFNGKLLFRNLKEIHKFLEANLSTLNVFVHNYYFVGETKKIKDNFNTYHLLVEIIKQIEIIFNLLKDWNDKYNINLNFFEKEKTVSNLIFF